MHQPDSQVLSSAILVLVVAMSAKTKLARAWPRSFRKVIPWNLNEVRAMLASCLCIDGRLHPLHMCALCRMAKVARRLEMKHMFRSAKGV